MATEVYQPQQELPVTTVVYSLPTPTDTPIYEDPNDQVFLGDIQFVGRVPVVSVA